MIRKLDKELADAEAYFELGVSENDDGAIRDAEPRWSASNRGFVRPS